MDALAQLVFHRLPMSRVMKVRMGPSVNGQSYERKDVSILSIACCRVGVAYMASQRLAENKRWIARSSSSFAFVK